MSYTKTTLDKAAKRKRIRVPRFEKTEEWRMMQTDIEKGLKPGTVLQLRFTEADQQKYRITNRRTVARYIKNYITARKLPYKVRSFDIRVSGVSAGFFVLVECEEKSLR